MTASTTATDNHSVTPPPTNAQLRKMAIAARKQVAALIELLDQRQHMTVSPFSAGQDIAVGDKPTGAVFADLNGDGKNDMIVSLAGTTSKGISVFLADATTGAFSASTHYATDYGTDKLVADDFNNDGNIDIAFAQTGALNSLGLPVLNGLRTLELYIGNGHGGLTPQASLALPVGTNDLVSTDFNGDGLTDVAITNAITSQVSVMINDPHTRHIGNPRVSSTSLAPNGLVTGDFNEDGIQDLIVTSATGIQMFPGLGNGDVGTATTVRTNLALASALALVKPSVADLNGDGHLDLVLTGLSSTVQTLNGVGDGTFVDGTASSTLPTANVADTVTADLNHDGINDIAAIDKINDRLIVETLNADGTIQSVANYAAGLGATALNVVDADGDRKYEIVSVDNQAGVIHILENNQDGTEVGILDSATHTLSIQGTSGDDSIVMQLEGTQLAVWRNGVRATFTNADVRRIVIEGLQGNDTIDCSALTRGVYVQGGDGNDTILGSQSNDYLRGANGNDSILGNDGDDRIEGYRGNDSIRGGNGIDRIKGDLGNDLLEGNAGSDRIYGGFGNDTLIGGSGNDGLFGDQGNDVLFGGAGNDMLDGGDGIDRSDSASNELTVAIELGI